MPQTPGQFCDEQFSGTARLFPLPGLVVFPHVVQALHIYEPHYRQMLADCLRDDKLIAMATLTEGWQGEYDGQPPILPEICLGQVTSHSHLDDGCSNILLVGVRRARIVKEIPSDRLYRSASIEIVHDNYSPSGDSRRRELQCDLIDAFKGLMPQSALVADQLTHTMDCGMSLGVLTDLIGYSLPLPTGAKQRLLGDENVDGRARYLLEQMAGWDGDENSDSDYAPDNGPPNFPPKFSSN